MATPPRVRKPTTDDVLLVKDAARELEMTTQAVRDLIRRKRLPSAPKLVPMVGVPRAAIDAYKAARRTKAA